MKKHHLITLAGLLAATAAQAQYAVPAPRTNDTLATWEVDAGVGTVFNTNVDGLDNGAAMHIGAYKIKPGSNTGETVTKFGGELYYSYVTGDGNAELGTAFGSADIGIAYKLSRTVEVGIMGGVGIGRLNTDVGSFNESTLAFGYQLRPDITFNVTEDVGISLSYRYLHTFPLDSEWKTNPNQHTLELSVKVRY